MGTIGTEVFSSLLGFGARDVTIYDNDRVEARNLPAQRIYRPSDIGTPKVISALEWAKRQEYSECRITIKEERVFSEHRFDGIVIAGVDSNEARREIWKAVKASETDVDLYIDGSLGGEYTHVRALIPYDPDAAEKYEEYLFGMKKTRELPCGAKSFPGASKRMAAMIERIIINYWRCGEFPENTREYLGVPYSIIISKEGFGND